LADEGVAVDVGVGIRLRLFVVVALDAFPEQLVRKVVHHLLHDSRFELSLKFAHLKFGK
jgi:hypothetical protein